MNLTPYYSYLGDIVEFHSKYNELCNKYHIDYKPIKEYCDEYFYLPARDKHCSTDSIFFDNLLYTKENYGFVNNLLELWIPS